MCFPVKDINKNVIYMISKLARVDGTKTYQCINPGCNGTMDLKVTDAGVSGKCNQCGYSFGGEM